MTSSESIRNNFKDIFLQNDYSSDLDWSLRPLNLMTTNGSSFNLPKDLNNLKNEFIKTILLQLPEGLKGYLPNKSDVDIVSSIRPIVEEISCMHNKTLIRVLSFVVTKLLKSFFSSIQVNENQLLKVKEIMKTAPVVFLPSHRSYCDFILMAYICYFYDIEVPCVAAAIEFNSMQFVGKLIKQCKAFYIRRKFNESIMYKFIFQQYLQFLIKHGNYPVEFFIEGTRSRSGKALTPKLGLLKVIMESYCQGEVPDIVIVPVNISYDRILEDSLFAHEVLGFPKLRESTSGLIKALRSLEKNGSIFVNFDEPIYLRSYLYSFMNQSSNLNINDSIANPLKKLGHFIVRRQQEMQVITITNLLCVFLHEKYVLRGTTVIHKSELLKNVLLLSEILNDVGVLVNSSGSSMESIDKTVVTHSSFLAMTADLVHLAHTDNSSVGKEGWLGDGVLVAAVPVLTLQVYVNPLIFILAIPSLILLILKTSSTGIPIESCRQEYYFIRKLFFFECVLEEDMEQEEFDKGLLFLTRVNLVSVDGDFIEANRKATLYPVLISLLYPFLNAYHCLSQMFLKEPLTKSGTKEVFKCAQSAIQVQLLTNHANGHLASLSTDVLKNGLDSFVAMGALERYGSPEEWCVKNMECLKQVESKLGVILKCINGLKDNSEVFLPSKL